MTTETTYNGWTNYETWLVKLWLDNDEGSYRHWQTQTRQTTSAYDLAQQLKADHEENAPDLTGVYADLIGAALAAVNWDEIARSMIDDRDDTTVLDD